MRMDMVRKGILTILLSICLAAAAHAERLAVGGDVANARSGPGDQFDILWKVEKYHPLLIQEKKGDWRRFRDFEGDEGWINRSLLQDIKTVIVVKDNCNIRSGPGPEHEILFTVGKGIPFKVLEEKDHWLYLEHADGDKGWIHESLVW
jgi:SH3-like domain-containing protein